MSKPARKGRRWLRSKYERAKEKGRRWGGRVKDTARLERELRVEQRALPKGPEGDKRRAEIKAERRVNRKRALRAANKRRFWRKRARFWFVRWQHRKELDAQRRAGQPKFEAWMLNGHPEPKGTESKAFIARAVVLWNLTVTSTVRTYVPAGGSSSSFHLAWVCGCAVDVAGPMDRMEDCQRAEYARSEADELFGPINDKWLKYGEPTAGAEGSPLEQLHDTHVHEANRP